MRIPFVGGHRPGKSLDQSPQTLINFYIEPPQQEGDPAHLFGMPGYAELTALVTPHAAQVRGLYWLGDGAYRDEVVVVLGNRVYTYNVQTNVWTDRNAATRLATTTGPVDIAYNGASAGDVWIADIQNLYHFDRTGPSFATLALPAGSNTCAFIDGYLIADDNTSTGTFYYSNLYDGATVSSFNFATAEGSPDRLIGVRADRRELWLFGESTTEVWFPSGDGNLPFQRFQGGFVEVGIAAPLTACTFDNSMVWLSKNRRGQFQVVRAGEGYQPVVISTPELSALWAEYRVSINWGVSTYYAFAKTMQIGGHEFYVLTFTNTDGANARATFYYDAVTKEWGVWRTGSGNDHMMQAMAHYGSNIPLGGGVSLDGCILIGDSAATGLIYRLSETVYNEAGTAINRERTLPTLRTNRKKTRVAMFELDTGNASAPGNTANTTVGNPSGIAQGATSVDLALIGSTAVGDSITIVLNNGWTHFALVTGVAGATISFADSPTPAAAANGNAVLTFRSNQWTLTWAKGDATTFVTPTTMNAKAQTRAAANTDNGTLRWKKLGVGRDWTFKLACTGRAQASINDCFLHVAGEDAPL